MEKYSCKIRKIFITPYYRKISYIETYTYQEEYSIMSTTLKRKITEEVILSDKRIKGTNIQERIRSQIIREIEFKRLDGFTFTRKITKNGNVYEETSTINQLEEGVIYL